MTPTTAKEAWALLRLLLALVIIGGAITVCFAEPVRPAGVEE